MPVRPATESVTTAIGIALLCVLTVATGWLVLRGGSFAAAIPAMGALTVVFVALLVHPPRERH
jgi:uncharacterized membrane protein